MSRRPTLALLLAAALLLPVLTACQTSGHLPFKPTHQPSGR